MEKRIVVAGSRDFESYTMAQTFIAECIRTFSEEDTLIFLSGHCRGADRLGERFAKESGWSIEHYPADWKRYGKAAGPIRNKQMVDVCDLVICFWNGKSKGTLSLIQYARKAGKPVVIKEIESRPAKQNPGRC